MTRLYVAESFHETVNNYIKGIAHLIFYCVYNTTCK